MSLVNTLHILKSTGREMLSSLGQSLSREDISLEIMLEYLVGLSLNLDEEGECILMRLI